MSHYPKTKVYFDGSHYIGIPPTAQSWKKRKNKSTRSGNELKVKFEELYNENKEKNKKEKEKKGENLFQDEMEYEIESGCGDVEYDYSVNDEYGNTIVDWS